MGAKYHIRTARQQRNNIYRWIWWVQILSALEIYCFPYVDEEERLSLSNELCGLLYTQCCKAFGTAEFGFFQKSWQRHIIGWKFLRDDYQLHITGESYSRYRVLICYWRVNRMWGTLQSVASVTLRVKHRGMVLNTRLRGLHVNYCSDIEY